MSDERVPDPPSKAQTRGAASGGTIASTTTGPARAGSGGTASSTSSTTTTTTVAAGGGPKCPNPKTCDIYRIFDHTNGGGPYGGTKGWRPDSDGIVRIRFSINPMPPVGSGLTEDTMEAAFLEATRIIEAANPRLDYAYDPKERRTTRTPQVDGVNVFKFGTTATNQYDRDRYIVESDVGSASTPAGDWAYTPCEQRDGGCTATGTNKSEILHTIVHEVMHTTGLADLYEDDARELTMKTGPGPGGDRFRVTLGLGDVLGLRALYPTSAPMPPVYSP